MAANIDRQLLTNYYYWGKVQLTSICMQSIFAETELY